MLLGTSQIACHNCKCSTAIGICLAHEGAVLVAGAGLQGASGRGGVARGHIGGASAGGRALRAAEVTSDSSDLHGHLVALATSLGVAVVTGVGGKAICNTKGA